MQFSRLSSKPSSETDMMSMPGKTYDPENCLKEPELDVKGPRINGPTLDIKGPKI